MANQKDDFLYKIILLNLLKADEIRKKLGHYMDRFKQSIKGDKK